MRGCQSTSTAGCPGKQRHTSCGTGRGAASRPEGSSPGGRRLEHDLGWWQSQESASGWRAARSFRVTGSAAADSTPQLQPAGRGLGADTPGMWSTTGWASCPSCWTPGGCPAAPGVGEERGEQHTRVRGPWGLHLTAAAPEPAGLCWPRQTRRAHRGRGEHRVRPNGFQGRAASWAGRQLQGPVAGRLGTGGAAPHTSGGGRIAAAQLVQRRRRAQRQRRRQGGSAAAPGHQAQGDPRAAGRHGAVGELAGSSTPHGRVTCAGRGTRRPHGPCGGAVLYVSSILRRRRRHLRRRLLQGLHGVLEWRLGHE